MKSHIVYIEVIQASEDMILTNGQTYSECVYLGSADTVDNWYEVPINNEAFLQWKEQNKFFLRSEIQQQQNEE